MSADSIPGLCGGIFYLAYLVVCAQTGMVAVKGRLGMGEFTDRNMGDVHWSSAESHFGDWHWSVSNQDTAMDDGIDLDVFC